MKLETTIKAAPRQAVQATGARTDVKIESAREKRYESYRSRGAQELPQKLVQLYADHGWALKWKRILLNGQADVDNLADMQHKGWEPVDTKELPQEMLVGLKIDDVAGFKGLIVSVDTALFKIPMHRYEEIQGYAADYAESQLEGVHAMLKSQGFSTINESKTEVVTGANARRAVFFKDVAEE